MENKEKVELALKWCEENDISAYEDDGRIYVAVVGVELEISSSEVSYRALLQKDFGD